MQTEKETRQATAGKEKRYSKSTKQRDKNQYKSMVPEYLEKNNYPVKNNKANCINPQGHKNGDADPSAVVYPERLYCPVCAESWDIFDIAGILNNTTDFREQLRYVQEAFGGSQAPAPRPASKKKAQKKKPALFPVDPKKAADIYSKKAIQKLGPGNLEGIWHYPDPAGKTLAVDARFHYTSGKTVLTIWFDGRTLQAKNPPHLLYNLPALYKNDTAKVLISEGCKSADAMQALFEPAEVVSLTWNGGSARVLKANWKKHLKNREIVIFPDDDEPGIKAAEKLKSVLQDSNNVTVAKPHPEARKLKESGADVVELIEAIGKEAAAEYVLSFYKKNDNEKITLSEGEKEKYPKRVLEAVHAYNEKTANIFDYLHLVYLFAWRDGALFRLFPVNDQGSAEKMIAVYRSRFRHFYDKNEWRVYDGMRWARAENAHVSTAAKNIAVSRLYEIEKCENKSDAAALKRTPNRTRQDALASLAKNSEAFFANSDDYDPTGQQPFSNGVLNFETWQIKPHSPENKNTYVIPTELNIENLEGAEYLQAMPETLKLLNFMFDGNQDVILLLQVFLGHALLGKPGLEQKILLLIGPGASGKTTFTELLETAFTDGVVGVASSGLFIDKNSNRNNGPEILQLFKKNIVFLHETDEHAAINIEEIKTLTSGSPRQERLLFSNYPQQVRPRFLPIIDSNHFPKVREHSLAAKRRFQVAKTARSLSKHERDSKLPEKLAEEKDAFVHWIIHGLKMYLESGLPECPQCDQWLEEFWTEEDSLAEFFKARTEADPDGLLLRSSAYEAYKHFCATEDERPMTRRNFLNAMRERHFAEKHTKNGDCFAGIKLK